MGPKLNKRTLLGLPACSDKFDLPLFACERMFVNLRNLIKELDGNPPRIAEDVSLQSFLEKSYRLPEEMALAYTQTVFACHHNFDLTSKKLHLVEFETMLRVMGTFISTFSNPTGPQCLEINTTFAGNVNKARKAIKDKLFDKALERFRITEWDKSAQEAVRASLEKHGPVDEDRLKVFVTSYKPATRGILTLAKNLDQGGTLTTFFVDLVDTVALFFKDVAATEVEIRALFEYLPHLAEACEAPHPEEFSRFTAAIEAMLLEIYPLVYGKKEKLDALDRVSRMMGLGTKTAEKAVEKPPPVAGGNPASGTLAPKSAPKDVSVPIINITT